MSTPIGPHGRSTTSRWCRRLALLLAICVPTPIASAEPITCREIHPTAQLIANLERDVREKPEEARAHFNLARAHSIAYALNSPEIFDCNMGGSKGPVLSDTLGTVPPEIIAPQDYRSGGQGRQHLNAAIDGYARAVALSPRDVYARLGYGWSLHQAGRLGEAIAQYREAISLAWPAEEQRNTRPVPQGVERTQWPEPLAGTYFVTVEAAEYLIPLLDPVRDAAEIATLRERTAFIAKGPRAISPIIVPLVATTSFAELLDSAARVSFDLDGFGARTWTWITPEAGWLVFR